ncbi:MAG: hypothetical protein ACKOOB_01615, partial [Polynucleobacter victoriensis]
MSSEVTVSKEYDHRAIEAAANAHWKSGDVYRVDENAKNSNGQPKKKYYACSMLPYPSGKLHMG